MRRGLYHEMVENHFALRAQVTMAKQDSEMMEGIARRFAMGFRRSCFDLAEHDPLTFYSLGYIEKYWIELIYRDMDNVIHGNFENDEHRLRAAEFASGSLLTYMKNRMLSKRLVYKVSTSTFRSHLREGLPEVPYIDLKPPNLLERIRRRLG